MNRSVALRASVFFVFLATIFASVGLASQVPTAEILFLISASLFAVLFLFGMTAPAHSTVPLRVLRRM